MEEGFLKNLCNSAGSERSEPEQLPQAFSHPLRRSKDEQPLQANRRICGLSYTLGKRLIDLTLCITILPLLAPVMIIISCAICFDSPGPVFYREQRIGRGGQSFTILKYRSMYTRRYLQDVLNYNDCELVELRRRQHGKSEGDPRITPFGRILRQTSLDELPQLLNILNGDMTFVGPRPVVLTELMSYGDQQVFYKSLMPGMTGLWQTSGRSTLTFQQRVHLDTQYCTEWSHSLDFRILVKTLPEVFRRTGAY